MQAGVTDNVGASVADVLSLLQCPRWGETGSADRPVVLPEVQMHAKPEFKHRLTAQSFRFLQLQAFLDGVIWLGLEELGPAG